ncbi:MAG TPA: glycosyltransferase [Gaiellaceae bacterium]|nr:glycosyltransferase [Gaiellaceae bacterium]
MGEGLSEGKPAVSVVIAAHSVRAELERSLGSILEHAGVPVETIVVDNASDDGTCEWLSDAHPDVRAIRLERNEFGAARNHALPHARGRYTMFLDSDAALTPGALPAMVAALDANPGWALLAPKLVYDDGSLQLSARRYPPVALPVLRRPPLDRFFEERQTVRHHLMADADLGRTRPVLYAISACHLFRTELARTVGLIDPALWYGWEDADWCIRLRDAGGEVIYFPEATVIHSYRRLTKRAPLSRAAWRQLKAHVHFQWKYARRRRELIRLGREFDRA